MTKLIDRIQIFPPNEIEVFYYETFNVNGQELKSELLRFTSGKNYQSFIEELQAELDNNSPTPIKLKSDWGAFNRKLFNNHTYQKIREIGNQDAKIVLENLAVSLGAARSDLAPEDYGFFEYQWSLLISSISEPLTESEIEELNLIASSSNMQFSFNANGLIVFLAA